MLPEETLRIGEKKGVKRHLLVDDHGVPLSIIVTGANRHDASQLAAVLKGKVMEAPDDTEQNLCADKGYSGNAPKELIESMGYVPHVRQRNEEIELKKCNPKHRNHRWIVEVAHSWFNRFRKIAVRFEKYAKSYEALLHLAASIITWRKIGIIYG